MFRGTTGPQCLCRIPDPRYVPARGHTAGLFVPVGGSCRRDVVPFLVLCAQKRREHPCCDNRHDRNDEALGHRRNLLGLPYGVCLNSVPLITIRPLISPTDAPFFAGLISRLTSSPALNVFLVHPLPV